MRRLKRALTAIGAVFVSLYIAAWMLMGSPVIRVENHSARQIRSIEVWACSGVGATLVRVVHQPGLGTPTD